MPGELVGGVLVPERRSRRGQFGTSLVEFVITAPMLLLTLSGALDLGRGYYFEVSISDAARDGVRAMVGDYAPLGSLQIGPTFNQICNSIKADLSNVSGVTCQQVMHAGPYTAGIDYAAPVANTAVAVIWCGGVVLPCDLVSATGGNPVHLTGEVDVYYSFSAATPLVAQMFPASTLTMHSMAQGLTNW